MSRRSAHAGSKYQVTKKAEKKEANSGALMSTPFQPTHGSANQERPPCAPPQGEDLDSIRRLISEFSQECTSSTFPSIEEMLPKVRQSMRADLLERLLPIEIGFRRRKGELPLFHDYVDRFQTYHEVIHRVFRPANSAQEENEPSTHDHSRPAPSTLHVAMNAKSVAADASMPAVIGRYQIRSILGSGGFGRVYEAHDSQLDRIVAIKVPSLTALASKTLIELVFQEARTAAKLRHPGVVSIYDIQCADEIPYIVQELVNGPNLGDWAQAVKPTNEQVIKLLIEIVDAVGFAHRHGVIHRDLKPTNILIDREGHARVADFGLALHESVQRNRIGEISGTPAYMSPEQVRGESHRLDGRSEIWSLGVILYELIVGRRPFLGESDSELYEAILNEEPRPPRQLAPSTPKEIERICLKCLAKRQSDRYTSAADLLEDLKDCLQDPRPAPATPIALRKRTTKGDVDRRSARSPKGLRAFDEHDADFFLSLLPGPRDRSGLPDRLRSWKRLLEERDNDQTFTVGVIYGPSGCGKSSLLRAGLLPLLKPDITVVLVEASPEGVEDRLHRKLCKLFPGQSSNQDVAALLQELRETPIAEGKKLLIVIDQFEQWLYANAGVAESTLVRALRQCDGGRIQSIVVVRDDFWLATSRFFSSLEIPNVAEHNSFLVDLFSLSHARLVLERFGRAYGRLPAEGVALEKRQTTFLDQAIKNLSHQEKVIPVRLSLFAEMLKDKEWTPAALATMGGPDAVGYTFLRESFTLPTAPPHHRLHQKAAQNILRSLLPPDGSDIKGHYRSRRELQVASGYESRPQEFEQVLRVLDKELRLITPKDPETLLEDGSIERSDSDQRGYQLSHDYLVSSLRLWIEESERKSKWRRFAKWCRQPQRVTVAITSSIFIASVVLTLQFGGVGFWWLTGQWAKRPSEWLVQWAFINAFCIAIIFAQYLANKRTVCTINAVCFGLSGLYYFAALMGLIPDSMISKFGGIYDSQDHRWVPFMVYMIMTLFVSAMNLIAIIALRHQSLTHTESLRA